MKPIKFPEQNTVWAENQPEYEPLPAYTHDHTTISCWGLSWRERFKVLFTGRVWLRLMNFGKPLTPSLLEVDSPFELTFPDRPIIDRIVRQFRRQGAANG